MMPRYIDADKLYKKIFYTTDNSKIPFRDVDNWKVTIDLETLNRIIIDTPIADVQEVKHGKWLQVDKNKCRCSNCDITALIALYPHGDKAIALTVVQKWIRSKK